MLRIRLGLRAAAIAVVLTLVGAGCQQANPSSIDLIEHADEVEQVAQDPTPPDRPATTEPLEPRSTEPPVPTVVPSPSATASVVEPTAPPTVTVPTATPVPTSTPEPISDPLEAALRLSTLEAVACPAVAQASAVDCSIARVPLDAVNPTADAMIELMVARVDNGDRSGSGPVVFLQGGPGVGSVYRAPSFVGSDHDLVLFDQRGTGFSSPKLNCPEVEGLWEGQFSDDPNVRLTNEAESFFGAYEVCHGRLVAEGISLDAFNTTATANDVELLRRLFEYDQWSIWGISYGTRLGLTIMRDHPDGVRAAVLDSVVPFEVDFFATIPENGFRAIAALDAACDNGTCAEEHGDFLTNLSNLALALEEEPAVVTVTRASGATFPFRVDGSALVNMVFTQLYSTSALTSLPRQISRSDFGGLNELAARYVTARDPDRFDLSNGLYYSTWCREEFPFHDETRDDTFLAEIEELFGAAVDDALGSTGVDRVCQIFSVESASSIDDSPIQSEIPTLVFAGSFDPITPPAWSRQVADALANAIFVELRDHGHGMTTRCPVSIRITFLANPTAVPDTSCATETGGPAFE